MSHSSRSADSPIAKFLRDTLVERRGRNPRYSLRAFARSLEVSPSALSEILRGKRNISRALASSVAERICGTPQAARKLLLEFEESNQGKASRRQRRPNRFVALGAEQFAAIAQWHHFAILSLAETAGFRAEADWVSRRLGIGRAEAEGAIARLGRAGLLKRSPSGEMKATGVQIAAPDHDVSAAVRAQHLEAMNRARTSLDVDDRCSRDFSLVTMAIDPRRIPEARRRIQRFRRELCRYLESGAKTEVYVLGVQLFPVSRSTEARS